MERKTLKALLLIVGGIAVLVGIIWASVIGYYPKDVPYLLSFLLVGIVFLFAGSKIRVEK